MGVSRKAIFRSSELQKRIKPQKQSAKMVHNHFVSWKIATTMHKPKELRSTIKMLWKAMKQNLQWKLADYKAFFFVVFLFVGLVWDSCIG